MMILGHDSCRWATPRLPLLAGGELLGQERRRVERHALECPGCRDRLAGLREGVSALRRAAAVEAGATHDPDAPSLWPALARQIREARHDRADRWAFGLGRRRQGLRLAVALAAGLLIGAATLGLWQLSQNYTVVVAVRPKAEPRTRQVADGARDSGRPTVRNSSLRRPVDDRATRLAAEPPPTAELGRDDGRDLVPTQ